MNELTAAERAALKVIHVANVNQIGYPVSDSWFCAECWSRSGSLVCWPCPTVRLLDIIDAAEQRASDAEATADRMADSGAALTGRAHTAERELAAERERRERAERLLTRLSDSIWRHREYLVGSKCRYCGRAGHLISVAGHHSECVFGIVDALDAERGSLTHTPPRLTAVDPDALCLERERDAARAREAALRAAIGPFADVCEALLEMSYGNTSDATVIVGVGEARITTSDLRALRAALAAAPAAHACREPALREALSTLATYLDDQELWFDAPAQVETMERHIAAARAALAVGADGKAT